MSLPASGGRVNGIQREKVVRNGRKGTGKVKGYLNRFTCCKTRLTQLIISPHPVTYMLYIQCWFYNEVMVN